MLKQCLIMVAVGSLLAVGSVPEDAKSERKPSLVASLELSLQSLSEAAELVKAKNSQELYQLFTVAKVAQTLVSSFDAQLASVASADELSVLLGSNLYCKLQRTKSLYEAAKDSLKEVTALSLSQNQEAWLADQLNQFIREGSQSNPSSMAAAAHLVRDIHSHEEDLCGATGCLQDFEKRVAGLSFDPLDDEAFSEYLLQYEYDIASRADPIDADLKQGDCKEIATSRSHANRESYNWNRRNWIRSNTAEGEFVVTYDDGPHAQHTRKIMESWERSGMAKPAFFWLSQKVLREPELARETHQRGFVIGSHSESHGDLGNLARANSKGELSAVNQSNYKKELANVSSKKFLAWRDSVLDREILGSISVIQSSLRSVDPTFRLKHFRLPYGSGVKNTSIGQRFARANVDHFFWAVDSLDWQDSNPTSVMKRVKQQMVVQKRGLILFHDIQPGTVRTTELLINTFKSSSNLRAVSIKQMVP